MQALSERAAAEDCVQHYFQFIAIETTEKVKVEETGKRLQSFAAQFNLPFSFNVLYIPDLKHLKVEQVEIKADEVVVIHASFVLSAMISKSLELESVMRAITRLNPCVMVVQEVKANLNSPSFDALFYYSTYFDALEDTMRRDDQHRTSIEVGLVLDGIRKMVAAEGRERVTRSVSLQVWRDFFGRRVVTAALISAGITSCLCAIGVLWGCQKFRTKRKNLVRALLVHCIEGETRGESSQKSVEKMINLSIPYAIHFHLIIPSGSPPPPPQPSQFAAPLGKDGTPLPKLKPLHWDKVRAAPECSTVWDKLKASSFEFDEEMIESLFGYSLQNPLKNEEVKCKSSSQSPSKHILEPKRIQNITILSKALNATSEQVCEALLNGSGLCLQELEALVKMAPAKEEEAKLLNYKGDINELASAERFVKAMLKVPFAFLRVEAMLFKETFEDEVFLLRRSFSTVEEACKELRSSQLFLKLLEAVLKTGNRMNNGTVRGGAKAFKLDALLKLSDIKGSDGKTTLLHFVLQEMTPQQLGSTNAHHHHHLVSAALSTELCNVKKAAALDLDALISCVSNLSGGIANTQNLLVLIKDDDEDKFVDAMRAFLKHAERSLKEVREDEHRALLGVRQITEYFHGDDVSKEESNNPLRIFVIVRDFLGMLDRV
nr:formin-like protein 11 [Ipomoea batatas]